MSSATASTSPAPTRRTRTRTRTRRRTAVDPLPPRSANDNARELAELQVRALTETPQGRRGLTRLGGGRGLTWLAYHYLGLATPDCHRDWYRRFDEEKRIVFLAPRSHGKTHVVARVLALHRILTNRNVRILIVCKSAESARDSLAMIKHDLEENPRIKVDWEVPEEGGTLRSKGRWGKSSICVRRSKNLRDGTVKAVGVGSSITGGRYDLIILDDIDDETTVANARRRRKTKHWLKGTVLPMLDDGGSVVAIGTRKHSDDTYQDLLDDPTFATIQTEAILEWPDLTKVTWDVTVDASGKEVVRGAHVPDDAGGKTLWPEKWPIEKMLLVWRSIGSFLFAREYQNQVTDDSAAAFRADWLKAAKTRGATRGFLREGWDLDADRPHPLTEEFSVLWQTWDFSLVDDEEKAEEQDSDYTVGMTWGLRWKTQERVLLRMVRRRGLTPGQITALILEEAARFPQRAAIVVENNAFGRLYEIGLRRTKDLPIVGHTTDKKKHNLYEGVPGMSSLYEFGKVVLPYGRASDLRADEEDARALVDELVKELHGLGTEPHDDTVMCHWISEVWVRRWILLTERKLAGKQKGGSRVIDLGASPP